MVLSGRRLPSSSTTMRRQRPLPTPNQLRSDIDMRISLVVSILALIGGATSAFTPPAGGRTFCSCPQAYFRTGTAYHPTSERLQSSRPFIESDIVMRKSRSGPFEHDGMRYRRRGFLTQDTHVTLKATNQDSGDDDTSSSESSADQSDSSNSRKKQKKSSRRGRKPWWAKLKSQQKKKSRSSKQGGGDNKDTATASSSSQSNQPSKKGGDDKSKNNKGSKKGGAADLLETLDPYKAGQKLRQTLDSALTTLGTGLGGGVAGASPSSSKAKYYLDDRFLEPGSGPALYAERNPLFDRLDADDLAPEVLVVGATGEVGRLVVRRLLLDGRFRVRVLVRDLYSRTLNILGTGVTYCQGDLSNVESLEYAVTDVDKIVFCAGAPRPDEDDFRSRFEAFVAENLKDNNNVADDGEDVDNIGAATTRRHQAEMEAEEWNRLESVLELRSRLAEQVDAVGMANLIHAYQNVRHADYGTGQAAKRSLFKFDHRPEDFNLFAIDVDEVDNGEDVDKDATQDTPDSSDAVERSKQKRSRGPRAQCDWIKNDFGNAVFVGSVPTGTAGSALAGEAAVVSSRLRSREDPEGGLDLSRGFAGFVCRLCSDGGIYECFVRTGEYEKDGIEYVCEFGTGTKQPKEKQSRNKFISVRLPFSQFKATGRRDGIPSVAAHEAPTFAGKDVRQIGFRFRGSRNNDVLPPLLQNVVQKRNRKRFYLAMSYIKVYRSPPEPEFVYLSDARIPPIVKNSMIRDDVKQIIPALAIEENAEDGGITASSVAEAYRIFDEQEAKRVSENRMDRSNEETYFKYKGEKVLRDSGLNYCIVRVAGYNEEPTTSSSKLRFKQTNDDVASVSRADVAQVCVNALLDPDASNVSFYLSKDSSPQKQSFGDLKPDMMP